jgi:tetratricopeptide (TPR) repeat protein
MKKANDSSKGKNGMETLSETRKKNFRVANPLMARRAMEKTHAAIGRIMEEKQFKNIDEANAFLQKFIVRGKVPDVPPRTALEEAQDLMYSACEESSKKKRLMMARRALDISADCADAYVLLAEESAENIREEKDFYESGVRAGERALGPAFFQENIGHFWGILETRPYMRARAGLAGCLWLLGERAEAIVHFQDMLRLNPNDNQGLRYPLLGYLLEDGREREARDLMDRFPGDHSAAWIYTKALLKFKREGSNSKTDGHLMKALEYNLFVPIYLLGMKKLPKQIPDTIGIGDENEAVEYVAGALRVWFQTPGALEWLARVAGAFLRLKGKSPKS